MEKLNNKTGHEGKKYSILQTSVEATIKVKIKSYHSSSNNSCNRGKSEKIQILTILQRIGQ
jgi:hypothetical protein